MEELKALLREMDLEYFASGRHRLDLKDFKELLLKEKINIIDVRAREEYEIVHFNFAKNIPLNELPDRLEEIPSSNPVVLFCSCKVRILIAYVFLKTMGFQDIKILDSTIEELSGIFKPGFVMKLLQP